MIYIEYSVQESDSEKRDLLTALLSNEGFEGFSEEGTLFKAYIPENRLNRQVINHILKAYSFQIQKIEDRNWNKIWESSFSPVIVDDTCYVRASFHDSRTDQFKYEIVIDPKMSFGTAHHETTFLMISYLLELDLENKSIADVGCGTGILSILSEKKCAKVIDALDIDHNAYINLKENIELNRCHAINCYEGDIDQLNYKTYDLILANINRNTIVKHIPVYSLMLSTGKHLLISGILKEDLDIVGTVAINSDFLIQGIKEKNNWISALFIKK